MIDSILAALRAYDPLISISFIVMAALWIDRKIRDLPDLAAQLDNLDRRECAHFGLICEKLGISQAEVNRAERDNGVKN